MTLKMRLIAKTKDNSDKSVRLMIYESNEGIYLYGFSTMADSCSDWQTIFESIRLAKEAAMIEYDVDFDDWIQIEDPDEDCQNDWIGKVKMIRKGIHKLFYNKHFNYYINFDFIMVDINGMTVNERLFHSGLLLEFDNSKHKDMGKEQKILKYLNANS
jgi:biofilm protein TabA